MMISSHATVIAALRRRVEALIGSPALVLRRRGDPSEARGGGRGEGGGGEDVWFDLPGTPTMTCTDLDILAPGADNDTASVAIAQGLGALLRLLRVAIAECHPAVLNELLVGSPCPLLHCAFCDGAVRRGALRLVVQPPNEMHVLRKALFAWDQEDDDAMAEDVGELRRYLRSPACRRSTAGSERPPPSSPFRFSLALSTTGLMQYEFARDERLEHAQSFIEAAKRGSDLGELECILIYRRRRTPTSDPVVRAFLASGLPMVLGEPSRRGLWWRHEDEKRSGRRHGDDVAVMTSGDGDYRAPTRLVGLTLDTVDALTLGEWGRLCHLLETPTIRAHLRMLTLGPETRMAPPEHTLPAAAQLARALVAPASLPPLRLGHIVLPPTFLTDEALATMVQGLNADELETNGHGTPLSVDRVPLNAPRIGDDGYGHVLTLIGGTVQRLELLGQCPGISPTLLWRILRECPRLVHLNVRLSNAQHWDEDLNRDASVAAPLCELILDAGAITTMVHDGKHAKAPRSPGPTPMLIHLFRLVDRHLRRLELTLPTPDAADRVLVEALAEHCARLRSLKVSHVGEEFVRALVQAMEAPARPLALQALQLPLSCVAPASPLLGVLLDKRSQITRSLRALTLDPTRVELADRDLVQRCLQHLGETLEHNRTLVDITLMQCDDLLAERIKETDKQRTDASVRPPMRVRLALLSAFRSLPVVSTSNSGIPAEVVKLIWAFHNRRLIRHIESHWIIE